MSLLKTRAIVLKKLRLNEADNILTLLTSEGSNISAIAKSIRKTKSKFAGRLEPFSVIDLVLYKGKTLYTVTQVNTVKDNRHIHDYDNFVIASAMAELINKVTFEKGDDAKIYQLLIDSLELLINTENKDFLLVVFDWKIMQLLGHEPNLGNNCDCKSYKYLDLSGEEISCNKCRSIEKQYIAINPSSLELIKEIMKNGIKDINIKELKDNKQIENITNKYIEYQLEMTLKSRSLIGK